MIEKMDWFNPDDVEQAQEWLTEWPPTLLLESCQKGGFSSEQIGRISMSFRVLVATIATEPSFSSLRGNESGRIDYGLEEFAQKGDEDRENHVQALEDEARSLSAWAELTPS